MSKDQGKFDFSGHDPFKPGKAEQKFTSIMNYMQQTAQMERLDDIIFWYRVKTIKPKQKWPKSDFFAHM